MSRFIATLITAAVVSLGVSYAYLNYSSKNTSGASPANTAQIENVVHNYLLDKPEVIVEALQIMQRKQYEQAEQTVKQTQKNVSNFVNPLFHQAVDPVAGNPDGQVTIVEFFDYQCPHCVDMAPVIASIIKSNPDVRIVFKEFPIRGPQSIYAAKAALAANMQGKYYEFSHALLTSNQPISEESVLKAAKQAGLNIDKLKQDINSPEVEKQIENTTKLAQELKLFGTPAFFIGKTDGNNISYIPGQMDVKQLQSEIDKAK